MVSMRSQLAACASILLFVMNVPSLFAADAAPAASSASATHKRPHSAGLPIIEIFPRLHNGRHAALSGRTAVEPRY